MLTLWFYSLYISLCHGWFNIKTKQHIFVIIIIYLHCSMRLSLLSTQKTLQRFRSWQNTSLMSFWLRKTLKSRSYSRRIKVKRHHSVWLIVRLVLYILANPLYYCLCRTMVISWRTPVRARVDHGSISQADAPADDGKEGAGHQACAQSPREPRKSTLTVFTFYNSLSFVA